MRRLLAGILFASTFAYAAPSLALPKALICFADPNAQLGNTIATGINPNNMYFQQVDVLDCAKNTPSVQTLKMYEGVFVFDDLQYLDKTALGNNLADYVDAGGGVVQAMFNMYSSFGQGWDLQGRWVQGNYNCIKAGNQMSGNLKNAPVDANNPIVKGVVSLTAQNIGTGGLAQGATSLWDYDNGNSAIAYCKVSGHDRVDVNFYPNPSNWKGDGYVIIRNALIAVAGGLSPLRASPSPVNLPDTGTGATSAAVTVTFTNTSMVAQTATGIAISGTNAGEFGIVRQPTFPVTLAPNQTFTIDVNFSPGTMGMRTAKLSAAIAGMNVPPSEVQLNGLGIGAKLVVAPNPLVVGGTQIGMTITGNLTLTNNGGGKISISDMQLGNPAFSIAAGPALPIVIGSGGSFTVSIGFKPTMNGITKDNLIITTSDLSQPTITVPVSGYAGPPSIATDAGSVAFGSINLGAKSIQQLILVQNAGFSDLTVTSVTLTGANAADFVLDKKSLPGKIGAQQSLPIGVTFQPSATGTRLAQVVITSDDMVTPTKTVGLFGTGTQTSLVVAPNMPLDLGTVRVGATGTSGDISITANGNGTLRVMSIELGGANPSAFVQTGGSSPPFNVAANMTAKWSVACKPNAIGALAATANVVTDVGSQMVSLKCTGISPKIAVTPNLIDYGIVAVGVTSPNQLVKIENLGTDTLNLMDITIAGPDFNDFNSMDLPQTFPVALAPGKSVMFNVNFTPQNATTETARIDFTTDDPLLPSGHINVTGVGATAGLSVTPAQIDFGTVQSGTTGGPLPATITNSGQIPLSINSVTVTGAGANVFRPDRVIDKNNPVVLAPKQSFVLNMTFTPIADGLIGASLNVSAMGLQTPVSIGLKGTGAVPSIKLGVPGGAKILDFGDVTVGMTSSAIEVGLLNSGKSAITLGAITSDNPAFAIDLSKTAMMLSPNGQTTFSVTFKPVVAGSVKGNLSIKVKDGFAAIATLGMQGNGIAAPEMPKGGCAVAPSSAMGYGSRGGSSVALASLFSLASLLLVRARRRRLAPRA